MIRWARTIVTYGTVTAIKESNFYSAYVSCNKTSSARLARIHFAGPLSPDTLHQEEGGVKNNLETALPSWYGTMETSLDETCNELRNEIRSCLVNNGCPKLFRGTGATCRLLYISWLKFCIFILFLYLRQVWLNGRYYDSKVHLLFCSDILIQMWPYLSVYSVCVLMSAIKWPHICTKLGVVQSPLRVYRHSNICWFCLISKGRLCEKTINFTLNFYHFDTFRTIPVSFNLI
jgi:hypothetical protein